MGKKFISLLTALVLLFSCCFVVTNVSAADVVDSTLTLNADSTAKKLVFTGTDSISISSNIKKFKATATNEGIIVNSSKNENLAFVKNNGKWIINFPSNVVMIVTP